MLIRQNNFKHEQENELLGVARKILAHQELQSYNWKIKVTEAVTVGTKPILWKESEK